MDNANEDKPLAKPNDVIQLLNDMTASINSKWNTISEKPNNFPFSLGIKNELEDVKLIHDQVLGWWDNVVIEHNDLIEERDEIAKKIEKDLSLLTYSLVSFLKNHRGFGFEGIE